MASSEKNLKIIISDVETVEVYEADCGLLKPDSVKIETIIAGISSGTEKRWYKGEAASLHQQWDNDLRLYTSNTNQASYPKGIGYETIGRVVEVGSQVNCISLGDLVWVDKPHQTINFLTAQEAKRNLIPEGILPDEAVFLPSIRIALGGIHDAPIFLGSRIAVVGVGIIGLMTVQLALLNGVEEVIAVDLLPERLQVAKEFGARTFNFGEEDCTVAIKRYWNNQGADVVIETSGNYCGLNEAIRICRVGGTVVCVSTYAGAAKHVFLGEEFHRNRINLVSSMTVNECPHRFAPIWNLERMNQYALYLLKKRLLKTSGLITHRFPFEQAKIAYNLLAEKPEQYLKIVLER